jgi:hypothetical protein
LLTRIQKSHQSDEEKAILWKAIGSTAQYQFHHKKGGQDGEQAQASLPCEWHHAREIKFPIGFTENNTHRRDGCLLKVQ